MKTPRSKFVEGSPRLHYLEWNPAGRETLVLLHGNTANAWWWQPLAGAIDADRFRLLALDQRGHGDSEWVRPPAYSPNDYADDLAHFIRATGLVRPIVVGHSMGGISVLSFALRFAELARAAIAIDVAVTSTRAARSLFDAAQGLADRDLSRSRDGDVALSADARRGRDISCDTRRNCRA